MRNVGRKLAFVLASSNHGTMIVNRFDSHMVDNERGYGVGHQIFEAAAYDPIEVELAVQLLELRRRYHGDGVVALDCGANLGVHTIEWAAAMTGWGSVMAIEAQERIYYALAGNISINNCFNAIAMHAAVGAESGVIKIPTPDYLKPASFGSLELQRREHNEYIGQPIDYSEGNLTPVQKIAIDAMQLPRVDLIKLDVEGMELEALEGARLTIEKCQPVILVETIKTGSTALRLFLEQNGYVVVSAGQNLLAIHGSDETLTQLQLDMLTPQPVPISPSSAA